MIHTTHRCSRRRAELRNSVHGPAFHFAVRGLCIGPRTVDECYIVRTIPWRRFSQHGDTLSLRRRGVQGLVLRSGIKIEMGPAPHFRVESEVRGSQSTNFWFTYSGAPVRHRGCVTVVREGESYGSSLERHQFVGLHPHPGLPLGDEIAHCITILFHG